MGASRLRFSSEGPFVQNEEGGPSEPSTGFQLRRVAILADDAASITSGAPTPLTTTPAELGALSLNLRYRAELTAWLMKRGAWTATATVTYAFEYSADGGVTYTTWATHEMVYGGEAAHLSMSENVTERIETPAVLGSTLTGAQDGSSLLVRVAANFTGGPAGGEILVGFGSGVGVQVTVIEEL